MKRRKGKIVAGLAGLVVAVLISVCWPQLVAWYKFLSLFESIAKNEQGYPEYRHRQTGIIMVRVPGGTFWMGSPPRADGIIGPDEELQHQVTLSPYLMAKHEVTREQWSLAMTGSSPGTAEKNLPVGDVSWDECTEFCQKTGLCLPTEAQWEFACRAKDSDWVFQSRPGFQGRVAEVGDGKGGRFDGLTDAWFNDVAKKLDVVAWFNENSGGKPHPVGQKSPNGFGLYDMLGNVEELCMDSFDPDFYSSPNASGTNPVCESSTDQKIRRGACYLTPKLGNFRSTFRLSVPPSMHVPFVGFRPAYYPLP